MKRLLYSLIAALLVSGATSAQDAKTVTLTFDNTPLATALAELGKAGDIRFAYQDEQLLGAPAVTRSFTGREVQEVRHELLAPRGLAAVHSKDPRLFAVVPQDSPIGMCKTAGRAMRILGRMILKIDKAEIRDGEIVVPGFGTDDERRLVTALDELQAVEDYFKFVSLPPPLAKRLGEARKLLASADPEARAGAAYALRHWNIFVTAGNLNIGRKTQSLSMLPAADRKEVLELVVAALNDKDPLVRAAWLYLLGPPHPANIPTAAATRLRQVVINGLDDDDPLIRLGAVNCLRLHSWFTDVEQGEAAARLNKLAESDPCGAVRLLAAKNAPLLVPRNREAHRRLALQRMQDRNPIIQVASVVDVQLALPTRRPDDKRIEQLPAPARAYADVLRRMREAGRSLPRQGAGDKIFPKQVREWLRSDNRYRRLFAVVAIQKSVHFTSRYRHRQHKLPPAVAAAQSWVCELVKSDSPILQRQAVESALLVAGYHVGGGEERRRAAAAAVAELRHPDCRRRLTALSGIVRHLRRHGWAITPDLAAAGRERLQAPSAVERMYAGLIYGCVTPAREVLPILEAAVERKDETLAAALVEGAAWRPKYLRYHPDAAPGGKPAGAIDERFIQFALAAEHTRLQARLWCATDESFPVSRNNLYRRMNKTAADRLLDGAAPDAMAFILFDAGVAGKVYPRSIPAERYGKLLAAVLDLARSEAYSDAVCRLVRRRLTMKSSSFLTDISRRRAGTGWGAGGKRQPPAALVQLTSLAFRQTDWEDAAERKDALAALTVFTESSSWQLQSILAPVMKDVKNTMAYPDARPLLAVLVKTIVQRQTGGDRLDLDALGVNAMQETLLAAENAASRLPVQLAMIERGDAAVIKTVTAAYSRDEVPAAFHGKLFRSLLHAHKLVPAGFVAEELPKFASNSERPLEARAAALDLLANSTAQQELFAGWATKHLKARGDLTAAVLGHVRALSAGTNAWHKKKGATPNRIMPGQILHGHVTRGTTRWQFRRQQQAPPAWIKPLATQVKACSKDDELDVRERLKAYHAYLLLTPETALLEPALQLDTQGVYRAQAAGSLFQTAPETEVYAKLLPRYETLSDMVKAKLAQSAMRSPKAPKAMDFVRRVFNDDKLRRDRRNYYFILTTPPLPKDKTPEVEALLKELRDDPKYGRYARLALGEKNAMQTARGKPDPALKPKAKAAPPLLKTDERSRTLAAAPGFLLIGGGRKLSLWDVAGGKTLGRFPDMPEDVYAVAVGPRAERVAVAMRNGKLALYDLDSGKRVHELKGHGKTVYAVAFTPDGKQLISGSLDGSVRVWDVSSGTQVRQLDANKGVRTVAVSADGKLVAAGDLDRKVYLWDLKNGKLKHSLAGHRFGIRDLAFDPGGRYVASASDDLTARVWRVASGKLLATSKGHASLVTGVLFISAERFVTCSVDGSIRQWQTTDGKAVEPLKKDAGEVLAITRLKDKLYYLELDGSVRVLDLP